MRSIEKTDAELHSKVLDPVVDEVSRVLKILQNDDGSWGTQENKLDRAFTTSWALRAIHELGETDAQEKGVNYFKEILDEIDYNTKENFSIIARENFLKGFFNCAEILLSSTDIDYLKLKEVYINLLNTLEKRNWLSSTSIVSYVIFGLRSLRISKKMEKKAIVSLKKEMDFFKDNLTALTPDICLAVPEVLLKFIREPNEFYEKVKSLSDIKIVHILIALALLSENNRLLVSNIRSHILERFRRRQITEIDRIITKQLLDLTLLLRTGLRGPSLTNKLQKYTPLVTIESESPEDILFRVKLKKLLKNFGELNINALASYVLALSLLKEKHVYLLSSIQYNSIKDFFIHETIPIPRRRELVFEVMVLGIFVTFFILVAFSFTHLITYLIKTLKGLNFLVGHEWPTALSITGPIFGLIFWKIKSVFRVLKGIVKRS